MSMPGSPEPFPRGTGLPTQSPLYWVSQKDRYLRQLLIRDIEAITKRELLVYFTDCSTGAMINADDEPFMNELLHGLQDGDFDLLLETPGGITDCAENVISTLHNHGKSYRVIVPSRAKSNGTVIALAAEAIVMGANSELGPIDPSLDNMPCTFIIEAFKQGQQVNPILLQSALHALEQTKTLARTVLKRGMMKDKEDVEVDAAITALASRDTYHSHGAVVDYNEAKRLGLQIKDLPPKDELWQKLWLLRCMYASDARQAGAAKVFESSRYSHSLVYPPRPAPTQN